jgi:hypothetical protein
MYLNKNWTGRFAISLFLYFKRRAIKMAAQFQQFFMHATHTQKARESA